ncbi:hypothetical protein CLAIMM_08570, partial [Cladophialophora immunda]
MALPDEGATDWKVIVIDINDPCASEVNGIADIQQHFPGLLEATRDWFKLYKVPDGKKPHKVAFNGEFRNQKWVSSFEDIEEPFVLSCPTPPQKQKSIRRGPSYAMSIVQECQKAWKRLIDVKTSSGDISVV